MTNFLMQEDTVAAVDTLTKSFSQKWDAMDKIDSASPILQMAASHDLIFIVLGVSLIIWFVLLIFLIRLDRKVDKLEQELDKELK